MDRYFLCNISDEVLDAFKTTFSCLLRESNRCDADRLLIKFLKQGRRTKDLQNDLNDIIEEQQERQKARLIPLYVKVNQERNPLITGVLIMEGKSGSCGSSVSARQLRKFEKKYCNDL